MPTTKWKLIVSRRVSVLRAFLMAEGSRVQTKKYLGTAIDCLVATSDELSSYYIKNEDTKKIATILLSKIQKNSTFSQSHADECISRCNALVDTSKELGESALRTASSKTFIAIFKTYCHAFTKFVPFVVLPVSIEYAITKNITDFLSKKVEANNIQKFLARITTTPELPATSQEQLDLAELALYIMKNKIHNYSKILQRHADKYRWLSCYNVDEKPFKNSYYKNRMQDLLRMETPSLASHIRDTKKQLVVDERTYRNTIAELKIKGSLLGQVELLRRYVWLRTWRIEMQSKSNYFIQPLLKKIGGRTGHTLREVAALSPQEIIRLLFKKSTPNKKELKKRIRSYVLLSERGKTILSINDRGQKVSRRELGEASNNTKDSVNGSTAHGGVIRGRVRLLLKKEDVPKLRRGEILVTMMTSPEYIPAMNKAAAFVTDEGGVLCHAAIIAREMKKPCVIGTGIATKTFKDGNMIEVDADKGVVRIV
ncbi:MAG: PEP-utilizing enzyme [bacterium]|nr:PEP-utilizing enzyme [bacterium]